LEGGHKGIFTVALDGNIVYDNRNEDYRFPENEEIFSEIENCLSAKKIKASK